MIWGYPYFWKHPFVKQRCSFLESSLFQRELITGKATWNQLSRHENTTLPTYPELLEPRNSREWAYLFANWHSPLNISYIQLKALFFGGSSSGWIGWKGDDIKLITWNVKSFSKEAVNNKCVCTQKNPSCILNFVRFNKKTDKYWNCVVRENYPKNSCILSGYSKQCCKWELGKMEIILHQIQDLGKHPRKPDEFVPLKRDLFL